MKGFVARVASVRGRITLGVTVLFAVVMVFGGWFLLNRAEVAWVDDLTAQDLAQLEMLAEDLKAFDLIVDGGILPVGVDGTSFTLVDESGTLVASTPIEVFRGGVIVGGPIPTDGLPDGVFGPDFIGSI